MSFVKSLGIFILVKKKISELWIYFCLKLIIFKPKSYIRIWKRKIRQVYNNILINKYVLFIFIRRSVDDPEVKQFIKLDNDVLEKFSSGFFEDVFPYLKNIFTTAKWKELLVMSEEVLNILRKKFKEHRETFQPGDKS